MDWRHVLLAFVVVALVLGLGVLVIAKSLGLVLFGAAAGALFLAAVVAAAVLAWPVAYLVIVIVYWARPDQRAPSADYSISQGREAGQAPPVADGRLAGAGLVLRRE